MSEKMFALVKTMSGKGLTLQEVDIPKTGINDVKIRVLKTAICGTDVHIYNWDSWSERTIKTPMVIGHEFVGEIIELGSNVVGFNIGDIVSGEGHIVCKTCRNCMAGKRHLCKNTKGVGVNRDGAFAQYLVIPCDNVVKLESNISLDICACFDPLGNAIHTALKFDLVGEDVIITGAGPIGIMAAAVCRHCGAKNIVITDVNEYRLALAKKLTPDVITVNVAKETIEDAMHQLGMKEGFDVGLEMSGNEAAFNTMIDHMDNGAKIALLGIHSGKTVIDWDKVVFNGLTIQGIYGREMFETWYKMMSMLKTGLNVDNIITHRFHFTEYEKGFEAMNSGNAGKVVLDWTKIEK
ncbi:MAG: L-threonine 3-dehydrogenase [Oscillospiraceae bacterium]